MVSFFGRPLLEHILLLLRRNGIGEAALTLHYLPEQVEDYFGDGHSYGMKLTWFREKEPLGTAGAVKACEEFLGEDEDFLVLSGDVLCDFDLKGAIDFHRQHHSDATLVLYRSDTPLEYGLVRTDDQGRIVQFLEKPNWGQVFTNQVNTGIYVLSRSVLEQVPTDVPCDFGRDLFPQLLEEQKDLYGFLPYGYWRDIGDCTAYLQGTKDALDGKIKVDVGLPQVRGGVWSASEIPPSVTIIPPCYIGQGVRMGEHALIGPHTVLENGSDLAPRSVVQGSVIMGASVGAGATVTGGILCPNSTVQAGAVLNRGTVVGGGAAVEENAILRQNVKVWPGLRVSAGARLNASLTSGTGDGRILFEDSNTISGGIGLELTPELLVSIGSQLGEEGKVGLGCSGGTAAQSFLLAAAAGVCSAGGTALLQDSSTPRGAAWLGNFYGLPVSLFLRQEGEKMTLYFFDRHGLPLSRPRQRKLENSLLRGTVRRATAGQIGRREELTGADQGYVYAALQQSGSGAGKPLTVGVSGHGAERRLLVQALKQMGMEVKGEDTLPRFEVSQNGKQLLIQDETGKLLTAEESLLLTVFLLLEKGEREIALPSSAPAAAGRLAEHYSGAILSLGRDGTKARELAEEQLCLQDGIFAACLLCRRLAQTGETISHLTQQLPACVMRQAEIELSAGRGHAMERFAQEFPQAESTGDGLRIKMGSGSVFIAPRSRLSALKISAEAGNAEIAHELCDFISNRARELDSL
jgi:mannose-1-phosphate guanylyltransferase/phosphomannomutase